MAKKVCPRLHNLATAPVGGITQPRTHFFGQLCIRSGGGRSGRETPSETLDMAPLPADCCGDIESPPSNGGVSAKAKAKKSILKRDNNSSPAERENLLIGGDPSKPSSSSAAVADSTARS